MVSRRAVPEGAIRVVEAQRIRGERRGPEPDRLAVEAPLEIRFEGRPFTVLMRTPGHDEELVLGFLVTEGIVAGRADVVEISRPRELLPEECANRIEVRLAPGLGRRVGERTFYASASCGVCGKSSIEELAIRAPRIESELRVDAAIARALPEKLRESQPVFEATGGIHAAGIFGTDGSEVAVREDVGRHNAVDKLVGWAANENRLPLAESMLVVSGRVGYEIVQKAIVARVPIVGAVGAASSLAVDLAERYGVTLATFLGERGMNVFGPAERIVGPD